MLFSMIYLVPGDPATIALGPRATPEMKAQLSRGWASTSRSRCSSGTSSAVSRGAISASTCGRTGASRRSSSTTCRTRSPHRARPRLVGRAGHRPRLLLGAAPQRLARPGDRRALRRRDRGAVLRGRALLAAGLRGGLRWLPAIGAGEAGDLGDQLRHLVLPAFAIGLGWVGYSRAHGAGLDARGDGRELHPHGARLRPARANGSSTATRSRSRSCRP